MTLFAVLMAGGSGTRFWPASRAARPKQLLAIGTTVPLLVHTSQRIAALVPPERQIVVTNANTVAAVRELLPDVPAGQVVGEPVGRDTAACIGLASRLVARLDAQATVIAMPSDHVVASEQAFQDHLALAERVLADRPDAVLLFGVEPDRPATGYGYLKCGAVVASYDGHDVFALERFVEKPDIARARRMLADGGFFWNAGVFGFRPAGLAAAYDACLPAMGRNLDRIAEAWDTPDFERVLGDVFPGLERISIDYGVMEKLEERRLMLPLDVRWDDVGSWSSLVRLEQPDAAGNVSAGEALALGASNNILASTGGIVVVKGVDDLIVVHTPDATLVCRRGDDQGVRDVVEALRERGLQAYL